jgi:hypothetical protein
MGPTYAAQLERLQQAAVQRLQKISFVGSLPFGHLENREDTWCEKFYFRCAYFQR